PTEWGSILFNPTNPDGTKALPWLADNSYDDIPTALKNNLVTQVQLANVCQMAVAVNPSFAVPLGLIPAMKAGQNNTIDPSKVDAEFDALFRSNPNNVALLNAWLSLPIQKD